MDRVCRCDFLFIDVYGSKIELFKSSGKERVNSLLGKLSAIY